MEAGSLRHKIKIQYPVETENPTTGEQETTWKDYATVWAEILPAVGREYWSSKQVVSEVTGKIKIRYLSGINTKMRVVYGLKIYDIKAVINVEEKNIEIVMMVSER